MTFQVHHDSIDSSTKSSRTPISDYTRSQISIFYPLLFTKKSTDRRKLVLLFFWMYTDFWLSSRSSVYIEKQKHPVSMIQGLKSQSLISSNRSFCRVSVKIDARHRDWGLKWNDSPHAIGRALYMWHDSWVTWVCVCTHVYLTFSGVLWPSALQNIDRLLRRWFDVTTTVRGGERKKREIKSSGYNDAV